MKHVYQAVAFFICLTVLSFNLAKGQEATSGSPATTVEASTTVSESSTTGTEAQKQETTSLETAEEKSNQTSQSNILEETLDDDYTIRHPYGMLAGKVLKRFGYDIFKSPSSLPNVNSISRDYRFKKGDKVKVFFWGNTVELMSLTGSQLLEPIVNATIDSEGNLFVPGVGVIFAEGNSIAGVEQDIKTMLSTKYTDFKVRLTVEDPRNFSVIVVGNVRNPGVISANSASTLIDILSLAGGVRSVGSLRHIVHIDFKSKAKTTIDLYDLLINGNYKQLKIKEGDVILVKPIGKTLALVRGVKNPAVYEFKETETLKTIVGYAGGFIPSINPDQIQLERYDKTNKTKILSDLSESKLGTIKPNDGDVLFFDRIWQEPENYVLLNGNIKNPRRVEFKQGMRLSDVLSSKDELLNNTFTSQAFIHRLVGLEKSVITIPLDLDKFFAGQVNPTLENKDSINILASTKTPTFEVMGDILNPGMLPLKTNMRLTDSLMLVKLKGNPNDMAVELTSGDKTATVYLYELLTQRKLSANLLITQGDKLMFRPVTPKESLNTVYVLGQVMTPGQFKIRPGMKLKDLLSEAGGVTPNGYLKGIVFIRPNVAQEQNEILQRSILQLKEDLVLMSPKLDTQDVQVQQNLLNFLQAKAKENTGRIALNITDNNIANISELDNIEIQDGDSITIPETPKHILVIGDVYNQSAIAYIPGKKIDYYIDSTGGFTKNAKKRQTFVIRSTGRTERPKDARKIVVENGDAIIIPSKIHRVYGKYLETFKDIMQVGFQAASAAFILTKI